MIYAKRLDSNFDQKVTSSIILKIEVTPRQPLQTPIFKPLIVAPIIYPSKCCTLARQRRA